LIGVGIGNDAPFGKPLEHRPAISGGGNAAAVMRQKLAQQLANLAVIIDH